MFQLVFPSVPARERGFSLESDTADSVYIEERFLDCVSRRFAQKQRRGTLRSE